MIKKTLKVIGLMSGTSLDGVDLCVCEFSLQRGRWNYIIHNAQTIPYPDKWKYALKFNAPLSAEELLSLDHNYGKFLGELILKFIREKNLETSEIDLISSHGHTLFHQPQNGFTFQLGNGAEIFTRTGIKTICDFRRQDVAMGGQGAPLVPVGDHFLFAEHHSCLNLGGFANISFVKNGHRIAFDICAVNYIMNAMANIRGQTFDNEGKLARKGNIHDDLLAELNTLPFYKQPYPKSLGAEWVKQNVDPILMKYSLSAEDLLRTYAEHCSQQIAAVLDQHSLKNCLITGGGAYNSFLMELTSQKTKTVLNIPDKKTIEFKEALIFAFMGVLRLLGEVNILQSVTGCREDHSAGIIYG